MSVAGSDGSRMNLADRGADVWLVLGAGLSDRPVTGLITEALAGEFGDRFAVVRSGELLMGAGQGGLTLRGLDGRGVAAPRLAYGRVWTPGAGVEREITLLRHLEAMGSALLNPADAVWVCLDKFRQMQRLASAELAVPETRMSAGASLEAVIGAGIPRPCVVKAVRGHRGEQVFLAPDAETLRTVHDGLAPDTACLFQEYVGHSHGRDLRVVVVDGRAAGAVLRTATGGEFRSNLALGATLTPCTGRYPQGRPRGPGRRGHGARRRGRRPAVRPGRRVHGLRGERQRRLAARDEGDHRRARGRLPDPSDGRRRTRHVVGPIGPGAHPCMCPRPGPTAGRC